MQHYRAYLMEQGHVWTAIDLVCADEKEARMQVKELSGERDIELWQGGRKIALLKAPSTAS